MAVELTLGAQTPERIDLDAVMTLIPFGRVAARAVKGGLDVLDETNGRNCVVVTAAVVVRVPL